MSLYLWGGATLSRCSRRACLIGRRESCDIVLRFSNVSAHHCQLTVNGGYWHVRDLQSRNGVKVNGVRVTDKRIDPGRRALGRQAQVRGALFADRPWARSARRRRTCPNADVFGKSLLERAGLEKRKFVPAKTPSDPEEPVRYDITNDEPGRIRFRHHPL